MSEINGIRERMESLMDSRLRLLLKLSLTAIEEESRRFNINPDFFKQNYILGREQGFAKVRRVILDQGNDFSRLFKLLLEELIFTPKKTKIKLSPQLMEKLKNGRDRF